MKVLVFALFLTLSVMSSAQATQTIKFYPRQNVRVELNNFEGYDLNIHVFLESKKNPKDRIYVDTYSSRSLEPVVSYGSPPANRVFNFTLPTATLAEHNLAMALTHQGTSYQSAHGAPFELVALLATIMKGDYAKDLGQISNMVPAVSGPSVYEKLTEKGVYIKVTISNAGPEIEATIDELEKMIGMKRFEYLDKKKQPRHKKTYDPAKFEILSYLQALYELRSRKQ